MKKIFLTTILAFSFSFCFTERPTGYQLGSEKSAMWISFVNNVDALGSGIYTNLGLDFSITKRIEMSFNIGRELGDDFLESSKSAQFRWWMGESLSLSWARELDSDQSDFLGLKFIRGDSWLSFSSDSNDKDNSIWALGKLWKRKGKMSVAASYHFSSDNIDKGNFQLTFGRII